MTELMPNGSCTVEFWGTLFGQVFGMGLGFGMIGGFVIGLAIYRFTTALFYSILDTIDDWKIEREYKHEKKI